MRNRTLVGAVLAALAVAACGSPADNEFNQPGGASGQPATGGSGGTAGTKATGGSGGASGSATGGSSGTSGSTSTGGTGGSATGGSGGDTSGTGGTSGTAGDAMGGTGDPGTGGTTGGTAGAGGTAGDAMGGTGGTVGGAAGTGGTGGTKGGAAGSAGKGMAPDCSALSEEYATTLAAARVCNADSGKDQCTHTVKSDLTCGCDVFVNPDNEQAVMKLDALVKQAGTRCVAPCPAIACIVPESASCLPDDADPSSGHCGTPLAVAN